MQATITKTNNTLYYGETQVNVYKLTEKSWRGDRVSYFIKDPTCHNGYLKVKEKDGNFTITDKDVTARVNEATMSYKDRIELLGYGIGENGQITATRPGYDFCLLAQVSNGRQLYYDKAHDAVYYHNIELNEKKDYADQSVFILFHKQGHIKALPPQSPKPAVYEFKSKGGGTYQFTGRNHGRGLYELLDEQWESLTFNGNPLWLGEAGVGGKLPDIYYRQQLDAERIVLTESDLQSLSERKPSALVKCETAQGTYASSTRDLAAGVCM